VIDAHEIESIEVELSKRMAPLLAFYGMAVEEVVAAKNSNPDLDVAAFIDGLFYAYGRMHKIRTTTEVSA
jgi:hypothetical protein